MATSVMMASEHSAPSPTKAQIGIRARADSHHGQSFVPHARSCRLGSRAEFEQSSGEDEPNAATVRSRRGGPGMRPGLGPPLPVLFALGPGLIAELLIGAGIVYDWRTRGHIHPAYLIGLVVTMAVMLLRAPLGETPAWLGFTKFLANF